MTETHYSYQSLGIIEVSTVLYMVDDPGHSLVFTLFYALTSFSGYTEV